MNYAQRARVRAALELWFGDRYTAVPQRHRTRLIVDVTDMATVEGMTALQAAMILDLRIHPATLAAYASTLRA